VRLKPGEGATDRDGFQGRGHGGRREDKQGARGVCEREGVKSIEELIGVDAGK
jgi:hypothetical protein